MADSSLSAIRTKVRRLTRSPSNAQITNDQIDEYVNTSVQYDLPEHMKLQALKTTLTFYTTPYIDFYETNTVSSTHPLYNFVNKYYSIDKPVYVDGYEQFLSQNRQQFYNLYPKITYTEAIGTGTTTVFSGTLTNIPVLPNQLSFTSVNSSGTPIIIRDLVDTNGQGVPIPTGTLSTPDGNTSVGTINYETGVYSITMPDTPASGENVNANYVSTVVGRPTAVLYFQNIFYMRPVPDGVYRVEVDAYRRATELLESSDTPELEQWWQYIAYLASKKVFEDRMDMESVQMIMPELKNQENLALRRTIVNQTKERTATIYTSQLEGSGWNWWGNNF